MNQNMNRSVEFRGIPWNCARSYGAPDCSAVAPQRMGALPWSASGRAGLQLAAAHEQLHIWNAN